MSRLDSLTGARISCLLGRLLCGLDAGEGVAADEVWQAAVDLSADVPRGWQQMRVRQGLYVAASSYLRSSRPGPGWVLLDSEVPLEGRRVDLLWGFCPRGALTPTRLRIEELKLLFSAGPLSPRLRAQLECYLTVGARAFGARFAGVRLVCLGHPDRSRLVCSTADLDRQTALGP